ncbi:MAG TPA: diaminopimelate epimerase, partial [Holosporales bacterium]|nr:diaminopimelate epimerase [Holosporales bacterium]
AGITPACGSGACAVGILGLKLGLIKESPVSIEMPGGSLTVEWAEGKPLFLTGPVEFCYEGIIDIL